MAKRVSDRQFAESKHKYTDPRTKERVDSVTAVVRCFDMGDMLAAGAGAAMKLHKEGLVWHQVWREKAELGTRVHGYAELWMQGKAAEVSDYDLPYMDAFALFCYEHNPEWLEVERAVVHSAGFGGRFDAVVEFDGEYVLLDLKTGKSYLDSLALQLAGYKYADGMIVYDPEGQAVALDPMPHIDRCAGLYLHNDGTYDLKYVEVQQREFQHFLALHRLRQWARREQYLPKESDATLRTA
jgi:hypothetical protein